MKDIKIMLCGPSGTGKTRLAQWVQNEYKIPFISRSAKELWPKYNIESHQQLIHKSIEDPHWGNEFQKELLYYRMNKLIKEKSFITDRSPVDNWIYYLTQCAHNANTSDSEEYLFQCEEGLKLCDLLINIKYTEDIKLEDDGMRVNNTYYQEMIQCLYNNWVNYFSRPKLIIIKDWDWEKRKKLIIDFLSL